MRSQLIFKESVHTIIILSFPLLINEWKRNFIQISQIDLELFQVRGYQLKLNQNETRLPVRSDIHIQSIVLETRLPVRGDIHIQSIVLETSPNHKR